MALGRRAETNQVKRALNVKPQFTVGEIAFVSEDVWGLFKGPDYFEQEVAEIPKSSYAIVAGEPKTRGNHRGCWYPVITVIGFGWCIEDALTKVP